MKEKEFWSASKIRETFLEFFKSKDHLIVPSDPIVRHGDPTLMFTNAGMNQFKDVFLGYKEPPAPRVANTQRCLRVSGKHNDLEQVGYDGYHHTMFEMLGNWSFGDYFKREAIYWAWELLTKVYKIPEDRLYATYFGGEGDIKDDMETREIWKEILPEDRILPFGMKDNFWEMGDTGPCGPCTEIHIDLRPEEERKQVKAQELINKDHPFVIELWNLVFIQFNRKEDGSLQPLKTHYVDTGMGLERLAMALQGVDETYKTDLFTPLIQFVEEFAGVSYGEDEKTTVAIRVVVDHIRAVAFAIADGALPSSTGPGYVVRRLLRRAVRYYYQYLNIKEPFLYRLLPILVKQFENVFPEIKKQEHFVAMVIKEEEAQFLRTLAIGLKRFQEVAELSKKTGIIEGKHVFELYDTYGFPPDLTNLLAKEHNLKIDIEGFHKHMEEQRERARKAQQQKISEWNILREGEPKFVGYDTLETTTHILRWREVQDKKGKKYHIVLEENPFYAEGGGQVGDKGILKTSKGDIKVIDTQKEMNLTYVITEELPPLDEPVIAIVDKEKRKRAEQHHSATHLLHAALRKLLGTHVQQKGSYLDDQYLRFDFSHPKPLSKEELTAIEKLVNQKIQENIPLKEYRNIPISEALAMGALAFFGEKYGDRVRVVVFDPEFSIELCGGTHVKSTGEIGVFKIISESGVSAGIRRIEAKAGMSAVELIQQQDELIAQLRKTLKSSDILKAVENLQNQLKMLKKEKDRLADEILKVYIEDIKKEMLDINGIRIFKGVIPLPPDQVKKAVFQLRKTPDSIIILGSTGGSKGALFIAVDSKLTPQVSAVELIKEFGSKIGVSGGGKPHFAQAGGAEPSKIKEAIEQIAQHIVNTIKA